MLSKFLFLFYLGYFILSLSRRLGIHFVFCLFIWMLTYLVINSVSFLMKQSIHVGIVIWSLGILIICITNQIYFPNSNCSELTNILLPQQFARVLLFILFLSYVIIFSFALLGLIKIVKFPLSYFFC